jgi:hypothetical protein
MTNNLEWFSLSEKNGKIQTNSTNIYISLYPQIKDQINNNVPVVDILNWIDSKATEACYARYQKVPKVGALNNCKGRWNEFIATKLLSFISLNISPITKPFLIIFRLPSSQSSSTATPSKFLSLFQKSEFDREQALYSINEFQDKIFFSSPDYVISIIKDQQLFKKIEPYLRAQAIEATYLGNEIYELLKGKLKAREVKAVASIKVSNRPDRRYQALYETAMIKAIGYASKQNWKYYMITAEKSSQSDQRIFTQGIAPHGIAINQYLQNVNHMYSEYTKEDLINLVEDAIQD